MNKNEYLQLEQQAKTAKKGIWVNYVAPVVYIYTNRNDSVGKEDGRDS